MKVKGGERDEKMKGRKRRGETEEKMRRKRGKENLSEYEIHLRNRDYTG